MYMGETSLYASRLVRLSDMPRNFPLDGRTAEIGCATSRPVEIFSNNLFKCANAHRFTRRRRSDKRERENARLVFKARESQCVTISWRARNRLDTRKHAMLYDQHSPTKLTAFKLSWSYHEDKFLVGVTSLCLIATKDRCRFSSRQSYGSLLDATYSSSKNVMSSRTIREEQNNCLSFATIFSLDDVNIDFHWCHQLTMW